MSPSAFISYSWDSEEHKEWVRTLARRLRSDGVDVTLDCWTTAPGDQLTGFMEKAIRENDYVIIVCTERYKRRSDAREGGVGYEGVIMTSEVLTQQNHRKFIPVLRSGSWADSAPSWLLGKYYVYLAGEPYSDASYHDLVCTLIGQREVAPPLGEPMVNGSRPPHVERSSPDPVEQMRDSGYAWLVLIYDTLGNRNQNSWGKRQDGSWSHPCHTTVRAGDKVVLSAVGIAPENSSPEFQFAVQRTGRSFQVRQDWADDSSWVWDVVQEDIGCNVVVKVAVRRVKGYYQFNDCDDYTYAIYEVLPAKAEPQPGSSAPVA